MIEHRVKLAGGVTLHVEEDGHGPALLLLHAGVADRHMWDAQWAWLSRSFRVVRWDWRGFGETPHVPGPFSYTDDVLRVMDALNIAQAVLMGCSFGGAVAIQAAVEHPEQVAGLVLVGAGLPGYAGENPPEVERLFAEAEAAGQRGDGRTVMTLMEQLWLVGPERRAAEVDQVYLERARQLLTQAFRPQNGAESQDEEWSALDRLAEITIPVLLIVGERDVPDIVGAARFMADRLPMARFELIEEAAHLPNMERSGQFDGILGDWLVTIGAAKPSGGEA